MNKKFAISGMLAAGAAGLLLSASPAQAFDMTALDSLVASEVQSAISEESATPQDASRERMATPQSDKGKNGKGKDKAHGNKKTTKYVETEGHETDLVQKNQCNNKKFKVHVDLKHANHNKVLIVVPSKDNCEVNAKTDVKQHGDTSAKKVRQ